MATDTLREGSVEEVDYNDPNEQIDTLPVQDLRDNEDLQPVGSDFEDGECDEVVAFDDDGDAMVFSPDEAVVLASIPRQPTGSRHCNMMDTSTSSQRTLDDSEAAHRRSQMSTRNETNPDRGVKIRLRVHRSAPRNESPSDITGRQSFRQRNHPRPPLRRRQPSQSARDRSNQASWKRTNRQNFRQRNARPTRNSGENRVRFADQDADYHGTAAPQGRRSVRGWVAPGCLVALLSAVMDQPASRPRIPVRYRMERGDMGDADNGGLVHQLTGTLTLPGNQVVSWVLLLVLLTMIVMQLAYGILPIRHGESALSFLGLNLSPLTNTATIGSALSVNPQTIQYCATCGQHYGFATSHPQALCPMQQKSTVVQNFPGLWALILARLTGGTTNTGLSFGRFGSL